MMNSNNIQSQIVLMVPARAAEIIIVLVTFLWLIRRISVQSTLQFWLKCYDLKVKITLLYFLS